MHKHEWQSGLVPSASQSKYGAKQRDGYICKDCHLTALPPMRWDKLEAWKRKMGVN